MHRLLKTEDGFKIMMISQVEAEFPMTNAAKLLARTTKMWVTKLVKQILLASAKPDPEPAPSEDEPPVVAAPQSEAASTAPSEPIVEISEEKEIRPAEDQLEAAKETDGTPESN
jgi:hypothetical protein